MPIVFSDHAINQLKRRGISKNLVKNVILNHIEISSSFRGRKLRRGKVGDKLLEVITKTEGSKITVITAYFLEE